LNKLSQFWQELKRRKVVRVITVYAAAAFVILELTDIVAPSLGLPDWTLNLIIILLCIGFIIAIILSWIYDIKPEGGIVKTEPAYKAKTEDQPASSNSWKIATYVSFVVIAGLIVFHFISQTNNSDGRTILDKSIAVLPFINNSPEQENEHIVNGYMMSILNNLSMIEELRVINRQSVEQYRNSTKPSSEIAAELGVSYLLDGSGQKLGNNIRLTVQLMDTDGKILWSNPYDNKVTKVEDHITLQSDIARLVAKEIDARITSEEAELIKKLPTTNLAAYEFYQKGIEKYQNGELENAEDLFHYALDEDSTYAHAYVGLARVYLYKNSNSSNLSQFYPTYFSVDFLDSVLILANRSISIDPQLSDAYTIRGDYYREHGQEEQAMSEYDRALDLNPNDWMAYSGKGYLYNNSDLVKQLDNSHRAILRYRGSALPDFYRDLANQYRFAGFIKKGNFYTTEAFKLDGDSVKLYHQLFYSEWLSGNFAKSMEIAQIGIAIDSSNINALLDVAYSYMFIDQFDEALLWFKRYVERLNSLGRTNINSMHRIGYAFWKNGYKEEADYYFNEQVAYCNRIIEMGREYEQSKSAYYDLAAVYAFQGEKDKAYENLRIFNQKKMIQLALVTWIKTDPLFDTIRNEQEFQQIVRDVEAKYQAEHERVKEWLEENDML